LVRHSCRTPTTARAYARAQQQRCPSRHPRLAHPQDREPRADARLGISQRIQALSKDALQVGQGSLYPALQRLEERGWIEPEWRHTEEGRRAKYYILTRAGKKALGEQLGAWRRYVASVELVLGGI
jgi:hypothetical protein